jgi:hypothetical protein
VLLYSGNSILGLLLVWTHRSPIPVLTGTAAKSPEVEKSLCVGALTLFPEKIISSLQNFGRKEGDRTVRIKVLKY